MKKHIHISIALIFSVSFCLKAQTFKIINVNTKNFPIIVANIGAIGNSTDSIQLKKSDIQIIENNTVLSPLEFESPKSSILPLSITLVLDNSSSMKGFKFDILKQTAKTFINNLPLEVTEVAIASFNSQINLWCDFTHNAFQLSNAIDKIRPMGGTNFNNAFLTEYFGTLDIAKYGKHKRVVIFITDGLSDADVKKITTIADFNGIEINCITIGLPIGDELVDITSLTGGNYYSELTNGNEIQMAFEKVYQNIQKTTYGKLMFKSKYSCFPDKEITVHIKNQPTKIKFKIPDSQLGKISVIPSSIVFDSPNIQDKTILIQGVNTELNISSIHCTNPTVFSASKNYFPITAGANKTTPITLTYNPIDTIFTIGAYNFVNENCPDFSVDVSNSGKKKLKILSPTSAHVFARNDSIDIIWKGIDATTPVDFYYQIEGESRWIKAISSNHFKTAFQAPKTNKKIRLKGLVSNNINPLNLFNYPGAIISGSVIKSALSNSNGSEIITTNNTGVIETWNVKTGQKNNDIEKPSIGITGYYSKLNRVVSFSENEFNIFTNRNGLLVKSIPLNGKKVFSSFCFINGKEFYTSALHYKNLIWDPSQNITIDRIPGGPYNEAACSSNGQYFISRKGEKLNLFQANPVEKRFSVKTGDTFQKVVLHNKEPFCILINKENSLLYNIRNKKIIHEFITEEFLQFHESGKLLLFKDSVNIKLYDLTNGTILQAIPIYEAFQLAPNGKQLAVYRNNSIIVTDVFSNKNSFTKAYASIQSFSFSPLSNKLNIQTLDSLFVYNLTSKQFECKVGCHSNEINNIRFATEKKLLIFTDHIICLWNIKTQLDSDTTDYFQIIIPEPKVVEKIEFPAKFVENSYDKVFYNVIRNETNHPVTIDSIYLNNNNSVYNIISKTNSFTLPPNENYHIEMQFSPKDTVTYTNSIVVISADKKFTAHISGKGKKKDFKLLTPVCNFGYVNYGKTKDTLISILKNTGTEPMHISKTSQSDDTNSSFIIWNLQPNKKLLPNDSLVVQIEFNPTSGGRKNSQLVIEIDGIPPQYGTQMLGICNARRTVTLQVQSIDNKTKQAVQSQIIITELNSGRTIEAGPTGMNGIFMRKLNTGLNYSVTAKLPGYFSDSKNIDITVPQTNDTITTKIFLNSIKTNELIRLNNIFFETGSASLLKTSKTELSRLANFLNENPTIKIEIHGHTDNVGTPNNNLKLSAQRAQNVMAYLIEENIDIKRLTVKYFGESMPIGTNTTREGKKLNRRVEIKLIQ